MVDYAVTASQVKPAGTKDKFETLTAAAAITAGQSVYKNSAGKAAPADNNVDAATAKAIGICVGESAGADAKCVVQTAGDVDMGAGAAIPAGAVVIVGDGAGGLAPEVDAGTGDFVTVMGVGIGSNKIRIPDSGPVHSGVAHA